MAPAKGVIWRIAVACSLQSTRKAWISAKGFESARSHSCAQYDATSPVSNHWLNASPRSLEHGTPVGEAVGDGTVKREASLFGEAVLVHLLHSTALCALTSENANRPWTFFIG